MILTREQFDQGERAVIEGDLRRVIARIVLRDSTPFELAVVLFDMIDGPRRARFIHGNQATGYGLHKRFNTNGYVTRVSGTGHYWLAIYERKSVVRTYHPLDDASIVQILKPYEPGASTIYVRRGVTKRPPRKVLWSHPTFKSWPDQVAEAWTAREPWARMAMIQPQIVSEVLPEHQWHQISPFLQSVICSYVEKL